MKTAKYLALIVLLSQPARAKGPGNFNIGLEMDEVSLLRINLIGYMNNYTGEGFRSAYPFLSFAFDGNPPFSDGFSPSLSFLYGPTRFWLEIKEACGPCKVFAWALSPLGTIHHFIPGGFENLHRDGSTGVTGSIYLKSNVDLFPFHKHPWIKVAPGLGAGLRIKKFGSIPASTCSFPSPGIDRFVKPADGV